MNYSVMILFSYSIFIAIALSVIRSRMITSMYYPFILLIWIAGLNEILNHWLMIHKYYNAINSNIYTLLEAMLLLEFFRQTKMLGRFRVYPFLMLLFAVTWIIDNFWIGTFGIYFNSYFNIIAALPIVFISINIINEILTRERDILKNPLFILCTGFIIYFTYRIMVELFYINGKNISKEFTNKVYDIHTWINLFCNLIYAVGILWMQRRKAFTLRF
jgi:hypothetical protein